MFLRKQERRNKVKTIQEKIAKLEKIKNEILIKSNKPTYIAANYDWIQLYTIEENIALWLKGMSINKKNFQYFYTDLDGNILFNKETFDFASPFSKGCAIARIPSYYFSPNHHSKKIYIIININTKEIVSLEHLPIYSFSSFRHKNISTQNLENQKWGSYIYNEEEKTFKQDIPPIWDALAFEKKQDYVLLGINSKNKNEIALCFLQKKYAYNTETAKDFLKNWHYRPPMIPTNQTHDMFFYEQYSPSGNLGAFYEDSIKINNNTGEKIDTGDIHSPGRH